jgi:hypothetical protein
MADLGKSTYEGEKDIAVQKDLYAAVMEALTEIIRSINPNFNPLINIQKGQGLTVERKPKGQEIADVLEIAKKPIPEPVSQEVKKEPSIQTLYGGGENNLTPDDIKAIARIMGAEKGHTVVGGEGLIIKYNGQPLFETDEKGQIMIHTAISPELKAKFTALQPGKPNPEPVPTKTIGNYVAEKAQKDVQVTTEMISKIAANLGAGIMANLSARGVPTVPEAIVDQYKGLLGKIRGGVVPENDQQLEHSIGSYMDSVSEMFDEIQQDDPNLGITASNAIVEGAEQQEIQKPLKVPANSIEDALIFMNSRDDGAKAQDGKGYNSNDTGIGKRLATQISQGEPLDKVQAKDALGMLRKYNKQLSEGGIKLPTWRSVQAQYADPIEVAPKVTEAVVTPVAIDQPERLDSTMSIEKQAIVLQNAFKFYALNKPAGSNEIELPTGAKFVNQIDDQGINHLSIEREGKSILLGGLAATGDYTLASTLPAVLPELRQLKPYLSSELQMSTEPNNTIVFTKPPVSENNENDVVELAHPPIGFIEAPPPIMKTEKEPPTMPIEQEPEMPEQTLAVSRGGR